MTAPLARLTSALADRYRIDRELGQGGMATVYLAHDVKHERRVALKVLHPELGAVLGGDRFLAEIKTTAHLQHPNILQLFDSGVADTLLYYVMPYVDGETLRSRLTREKQLPIEDAIAIARGTAAALDYAHRHGIIHRDIKPENILLQDGQPLVADFGIALAVKQAGGARLTQTGLSLGTPQYMSPEQATGERELDVRSDVYALGAVTYEMLTGEPPFTGNTTQAIIAKLMTEEPRRISVLRKTVPPHVEAAVHHAMEKLPADRFGSAAEFAAALTDAARAFVTRATPALPRGNRRTAGLVAAGLVLLLAGALAGRWFLAPATEPPLPSRLAILPPEQGGIVGVGIARAIDISRDGRLVAFSYNSPSANLVALRRLDEPKATALSNSEGAGNLHISPDSRFIYSPRGTSTTQRAAIVGGSWSPIPSVPNTPYVSFGSDGSIWWTPEIGGGVYRSRPGADKAELAFPDDSVRGAVTQQILPGDRKALIVESSQSNSGLAGILDFGSKAITTLFDFQVVELRYSAGVLVYVRPDNTLNAIPFDPKSGKTSGEPVILADDVALTGSGVAQFAVSETGTVVYMPSFGRELVRVDRSGSTHRLSEQRLNYHSPRYSPDGKLIALDNTGADGRDVWIFDPLQQQLTRTTFDRDGHDAAWVADGRSIYYASSRTGTLGTWRVRLGGGGKPDSIFAAPTLGYPGTPFGDGTRLLVVATDLNGRSGSDIGVIDPKHPGQIQPLFATPFSEGWAVPSPDGKWLAYTSDESSRQEVYIHPLSPDGSRLQVSIDGGSEPMWARNGRELFYRRPSGGGVQLVAAEVVFAPEPRVAKRTQLFDASDFEPAQPHSNYDVSPDGRSFIMLRRSPSSHLVVIQNVQELVGRAQSSKTR